MAGDDAIPSVRREPTGSISGPLSLRERVGVRGEFRETFIGRVFGNFPRPVPLQEREGTRGLSTHDDRLHFRGTGRAMNHSIHSF
jgi:hypothetical protein